jgi:asparagine synthase (glutamine-hydrolysing)
MGGICGSFGPHENLEELVESIRTEHDRVLYATNPGVALVGKEGTCLGDGFLYGKIYSDHDPTDFIKDKIEDTSKSLAELARNADGEFAIVAFDNEKMCVARDLFGKLPVFMRRKPTFQFITGSNPFMSSVKKARMSEGSSILVKKGKVAKKYSRPKIKYRKKRIDFFTSLPLIKENLENAIERRAEQHKNFDILFSGGLDSTILSMIAKDYANVRLITIGTEECDDVRSAMDIEDEMGTKLKVVELTADIVEKNAPILMKNIASNDVIDFEIAFPIYLAAINSHSKYLISGQGADELFGGYFRYNEAYKESPGKFEEMQLKDLKEMGRNNLERDYFAAQAAGCHISTPYLTPELLKIALSTDTMTKINVTQNKLVLRKIAEGMGLPESVYSRKKKALQYGCGIHEILRELARERGFTRDVAKSQGYIGPLDMLVRSLQ